METVNRRRSVTAVTIPCRVQDSCATNTAVPSVVSAPGVVSYDRWLGGRRAGGGADVDPVLVDGGADERHLGIGQRRRDAIEGGVADGAGEALAEKADAKRAAAGGDGSAGDRAEMPGAVGGEALEAGVPGGREDRVRGVEQLQDDPALIDAVGGAVGAETCHRRA